jgi:hypothetical protein
MKHLLKLNEIIYKRLIKGPASSELGSDSAMPRLKFLTKQLKNV